MDHASEKTPNFSNTIAMLKRIELLTLPEIRVLIFFFFSEEFPISFPLPLSKWLGARIQRTQPLLSTPLPPACVERSPLLFYPMTLFFHALLKKPCFHMHPSSNSKQRFCSFFPSGVSQFIIKLFDFKFFSCRFAEAESGMRSSLTFLPTPTCYLHC